MGVGPMAQKFFYFDEYIDASALASVRQEVEEATEKNILTWRKIVANGLVPASVNSGQKCVDSYLCHLEKYAPSRDWEEPLRAMTKKRDIKTYFHQYFSLSEAWEGLAMLRKYSDDYMKKAEPSSWLEFMEKMPLTKKFIESLPFRYIGYAQIFKSNREQPVLIHRDYFPISHNVQFINIRLDRQPRPFFLYDATTGKKEYVRQDSNAYFFNEVDLHGIDPEPEPRLTLRVEGQFADWFLGETGLDQGRTFDWNYDFAQGVLNNKNYYMEESTDL